MEFPQNYKTIKMSNCPMGYQITFMISLSNITSWNVVRCFSINFSIFLQPKTWNCTQSLLAENLWWYEVGRLEGKKKEDSFFSFPPAPDIFLPHFSGNGLDLVYPRPRTPITTISKAFFIKKRKKERKLFSYCISI